MARLPKISELSANVTGWGFYLCLRKETRTGRTGHAGRSGKAITLVLPEQQAETSHVARRLGHRAQFEGAGMQSARAKLMYTSRRGRRSKW